MSRNAGRAAARWHRGGVRMAALAVAACAVSCDRSHGEPDPGARPTRPADVRSFDATASSPESELRTTPSDAAGDAARDGTSDATSDTDAAEAATFETAAPRSGRSIGHTSVVFKLKLAGGLEAAYKPQSRRGPGRFRGEVAAYRVARALGLANVPRAMVRRFPLAELLTALGGRESSPGALLAQEAVADANGTVHGALIPWLRHLSFLPLEAEPQLSEWKGWLSGKTVAPADKQALAAQISTMVAFDYLSGNWDRWSGGNIGWDAETNTLLYVDNDGAFYDEPPAGPLAAQRARLEGVTRFSRAFVAHLRALDEPTLLASLGEESPGSPLLAPKSVASVVARRATVLDLVDRRIKEFGDSWALSYP